MNIRRFLLVCASALSSLACGYDQHVAVRYDLPNDDRVVADQCHDFSGSAFESDRTGNTLVFVNEGGTLTTPFFQDFAITASTTTISLTDASETILDELQVGTGEIVPGFEESLSAEKDGVTIVATYTGVDACP